MTMQSTKQNAGGIVGFVDDLNGAIRENPVAAGLIGMGVLWMFFGSARISAAGKTLPGAARGVTNAVGAAAEAGSVVGDAIAGTAWRASNAAVRLEKRFLQEPKAQPRRCETPPRRDTTH